MTVPCQIGLRCPHFLWSEEGSQACFWPHTTWTVREDVIGTLPIDMDVYDCPMVAEGRLQSILAGLDNGEEEKKDDE